MAGIIQRTVPLLFDQDTGEQIGYVNPVTGRESSVSGDGGGAPRNTTVATRPYVWAPLTTGGGLAAYSGFTPASGGTVAIDTSTADPISGLPCLQVTLPAGVAAATQQVHCYGVPTLSMGQYDSFCVAVYVPPDAGVAIEVTIRVTDKTVLSGSDYAQFGWSGSAMVTPGWNFLQVLDGEVLIASSSTTYGTVGTNCLSGWSRPGSTQQGGPYKAVAIRIAASTAPAAPVNVAVGSVCIAPENWAKPCIMWSVDDVPSSFNDYAVSLLESYGMPITFNAVSNYANTAGVPYMTTAQYHAAVLRGHEVWGHSRDHDNLTTTPDLQRALKTPRDYWMAAGFTTAAKLYAYPFGSFNSTVVSTAQSLGYKAARAIHGSEMWPLAPCANPHWLNAFSVERPNSWAVQSQLNGSIKRGRGLVTYMHGILPGGGSTDVTPGPPNTYVEHLRRWVQMVAAERDAGRCTTMTMTQYMRACGVDPLRDL